MPPPARGRELSQVFSRSWWNLNISNEKSGLYLRSDIIKLRRMVHVRQLLTIVRDPIGPRVRVFLVGMDSTATGRDVNRL